MQTVTGSDWNTSVFQSYVMLNNVPGADAVRHPWALLPLEPMALIEWPLALTQIPLVIC
jgi:hypothetical protein